MSQLDLTYATASICIELNVLYIGWTSRTFNSENLIKPEVPEVHTSDFKYDARKDSKVISSKKNKVFKYAVIVR